PRVSGPPRRSSRKVAAFEDLDFLLVVMLVHLFDENGLDDSALALDVDNSVGVVETDGAIAEPLALEGMVTKTWHSASGLKPFEPDEINPKGELADDVFGEPLELVLCSFGQFNIHWVSVPKLWVQSSAVLRPTGRSRTWRAASRRDRCAPTSPALGGEMSSRKPCSHRPKAVRRRPGRSENVCRTSRVQLRAPSDHREGTAGKLEVVVFN